jgi:hypothetical protein
MGAIHIICLWFYVGYFILMNLYQTHQGFSVKLIVTLSFLWLFGIIGLSPSILRSVTMFGFHRFCGFFKSRNTIYNTFSLVNFLYFIG